MKTEIRSTTVALRAAPGTEFEVAGLAAAYNSLSAPLPIGERTFRERIAPGAFTRALASKADVICCINHDPSKLLGRTKSGTLSLSDSPDGLRFICRLDPNQQSHRDLHSAVKRGDLGECSFSFSATNDDWDETKDERGQRFTRRTLKDVDLFDVSIVCHPAYPGSTSVAARSIQYRSAWSPSLRDWSELRALADRQREQIWRDSKEFVVVRNAAGRVVDIRIQDCAEVLEARLQAQADKQQEEIWRELRDWWLE